MAITKAIIPVAGYGTRRLPITKAIEKCMLPIGNRPIIDYVVYDCLAAGIRDIYFVINPGASQIKQYYGENGPLNAYLSMNGRDDLLRLVRPPEADFHFIEQPNDNRYGSAIPISLALPFLAEGESVVVLMGDDFIFNHDGSSEVARLLASVPENGNAMLCVNVAREEVGRYGVIDTDEAGNFRQIIEKPAPAAAPSTLINVSKYVFNYDLLLSVARYAGLQLSGEYYVTEPMNQYVLGGGSIKVVPAVGRYLDGGTAEGWLFANEFVAGHVG